MSVEQPIYDHPVLAGVLRGRLPRHIAIIPDGNDTWSRLHGLPREEGHARGADALIQISRDLRQLDELEAFTIWSISSQNIDNRDPEEIRSIMNLIAYGLRDPQNVEDFMTTQTRLLHLGRTTRLTPDLTDAIDEVENMTAGNEKHIIALLIDYGTDYELETVIEETRELALNDRRTARELAGVLPAYKRLPPLDVLVRSKSKPKRVNLSNLGPIVGEALVYPIEKLWPDVTTRDVLLAVKDFSQTDRNFGGRNGNSK